MSSPEDERAARLEEDDAYLDAFPDNDDPSVRTPVTPSYSRLGPVDVIEVVDSLTTKQFALVEAVRVARSMRDAMRLQYGAAVEEAIRGGVTYAKLAMLIGVKKPTMFRQAEKWRKKRDGPRRDLDDEDELDDEEATLPSDPPTETG